MKINKNIENILEKIQHDKNSVDKIKKCKNIDEVYAVLKKIEKNLTKDELIDFMKNSLKKINPDELAFVSGGTSGFGKKGMSFIISALIGASSLPILKTNALETDTYKGSETESKLKDTKKNAESSDESYLWKLGAGTAFLATAGIVVKSLFSGNASTDKSIPLAELPPGAEISQGTNQERIRIFHETLDEINKDDLRYKTSSTVYSLCNVPGAIPQAGLDYLPSDTLVGLPVNRNGGKQGKIVVRCGRSLAVVNDLIQKSKIDPHSKIGVLSFANYYTPGGGVNNGRTAQEESLCRVSDLYIHLVNSAKIFHEPNKFYDPSESLSGNRGLYTLNSQQTRTDTAMPHGFLPKGQRLQFDCMTVAAPDLRRVTGLPKEEIKELMVQRVKLTVAMAIANGVDVLVLGALGCGAFKIPPEISAAAFHDVLIKEGYASYFNTVVFPILVVQGTAQDLLNYNVFSGTFGNKA